MSHSLCACDSYQVKEIAVLIPTSPKMTIFVSTYTVTIVKCP